MYLLITDLKWTDIATVFLLESFDRRVLWMLRRNRYLSAQTPASDVPSDCVLLSKAWSTGITGK